MQINDAFVSDTTFLLSAVSAGSSVFIGRDLLLQVLTKFFLNTLVWE